MDNRLVRTVLIVHAHPDDEVFASGAAALGWSESGDHLELRVATGGEAGERGSTHGEVTDEQARSAREAKLSRSCELLGISGWDYLTEPGHWVDAGAADHPSSLAQASHAELARAVDRAICQVEPDVVMTVGRQGLTGHPDHLAIHQAVATAIRQRDIRPPAMGACLRQTDVEAGHRLLYELVGGQPVGSGRVCGSSATLHLVGCASSVAARRRQALDCYLPGLGTAPLAEFLARSKSRGDSVLLRAIFEATTWAHDYVEEFT